ncbi:MAG: hypothetical protein IPO74_01135 [Thermomonas sp.]|nr:hypothetical protein [Thermomonas sp.]
MRKWWPRPTCPAAAWVDRPHTVVAFGLSYFGLMAASKLLGWRLPGKPVVLRN